MGALLDQPSVFQKHDPVAEAGAGKTVRNEDGGSVFHGFPIPQIKLVFRDRIQRGGGLVQNDERRFLIQCPGKKQLLFLPAGKVHAVPIYLPDQGGFAFARRFFIALRKAGQRKIPRQAVPVDVLFSASGQIFIQSDGKQGIVLKQDGDAAEVFLSGKAFYGNPSQQDLSLRGMIEAADELDQRGFPGSVQAEKRKLLTGADGKADIGKGLPFVSRIGEAHISKLQADGRAPKLRERFCPDAVRPLPGILPAEEFPDIADGSIGAVDVHELPDQHFKIQGEGADQPDVVDEFGGRKLSARKQQAVGRPVPEQEQKGICDVADGIPAVNGAKNPFQLPQCRVIFSDQEIQKLIHADILAGRRVPRLGVDVVRPAGGKAGFSVIFPVFFPGDAKKLQIDEHGQHDHHEQPPPHPADQNAVKKQQDNGGGNLLHEGSAEIQSSAEFYGRDHVAGHLPARAVLQPVVVHVHDLIQKFSSEMIQIAVDPHAEPGVDAAGKDVPQPQKRAQQKNMKKQQANVHPALQITGFRRRVKVAKSGGLYYTCAMGTKKKKKQTQSMMRSGGNRKGKAWRRSGNIF